MDIAESDTLSFLLIFGGGDCKYGGCLKVIHEFSSSPC